MMKSLMMIQQNPTLAHEENMSNLTSASCEASVSSNQQQSSYASPDPNPNPIKKKRSLPGNPDPDAEVVALSPRSLLATNRFMCEICNKGFQREQNLQLHRRGHNLPWKLKQRASKEMIRKKVYVCPEVTCVHHDPSRALGDLTGVKKHFCRKHGEKKWKCDKCSKKYAVRSDWKAHSKTCGTREYRCDCGTLFSRRDSFITHRAFCDALAEESARIITANPLANHRHLFSLQLEEASLIDPIPPPHQTFDPHFSSTANIAMINSHELSLRSTEQEQQYMIGLRPADAPDQWLQTPSTSLVNPFMEIHASLISARTGGVLGRRGMSHDQSPSSSSLPPPPVPHQAAAAASPHMSATALLQKAAQMGAAVSRPFSHLSAGASTTSTSSGFGLGLSPTQDIARFSHAAAAAEQSPPPPLVHDLMLPSMVLAPGTGFDGSAVDGGDAAGGADGLTRDFLSLRAISSRGDILNMAGLNSCMSSSTYSDKQQQQWTKDPWQGHRAP